MECGGSHDVTFATGDLEQGVYILVGAGSHAAYTGKFIVR